MTSSSIGGFETFAYGGLNVFSIVVQNSLKRRE
jgi:hypothetical protein